MDTQRPRSAGKTAWPQSDPTQRAPENDTTSPSSDHDATMTLVNTSDNQPRVNPNTSGTSDHNSFHLQHIMARHVVRLRRLNDENVDESAGFVVGDDFATSKSIAPTEALDTFLAGRKLLRTWKKSSRVPRSFPSASRSRSSSSCQCQITEEVAEVVQHMPQEHIQERIEEWTVGFLVPSIREDIAEVVQFTTGAHPGKFHGALMCISLSFSPKRKSRVCFSISVDGGRRCQESWF